MLAVLVVLAVVSSAYFLKARQKKSASPASSDPELPNASERRSAHNDGLLEPELEADLGPPTGHAGNAALGGNLSSTAQGVSLRVNLKLWAWGDNGHGQVGDGTLEPRPWPVPVADSQSFTAIVAGYQRATAVRDDGTAWAWGFQDLGALGDGSDQDQPRPVPTSILEQVVRVAGNAATEPQRPNHDDECDRDKDRRPNSPQSSVLYISGGRHQLYPACIGLPRARLHGSLGVRVTGILSFGSCAARRSGRYTSRG